MKIMVLNSGSSSIKFQLIDTELRQFLCKGLVERIGLQNGRFHFSREGEKKKTETIQIPDHRKGIELIQHAVGTTEEIQAVGHRMVLGGEEITDTVLIDEDIIRTVEKYRKQAPLHNPPTITGYYAAKEFFSSVPHAAVFDTTFHTSLPMESFVFPVAYELYEKHGIRRFGFHGTSHQYVSARAAALMKKPVPDCNVITCHLGNGASITAVKNGKSVDTSLGFGTVGGIPMGTRSGDLDPDIILYLIETLGMSVQEVRALLYKNSGLKGVSGISNDVRDVEAAAEAGNERAKLALQIYAHYARKSIAGLATNLENRIDALVFTAGIGENEWKMRRRICTGLEFMGVHLDNKKNENERNEAVISAEGSPVSIYVIPTNEELMIALETEKIITAQRVYA